MEYLHTMVRVSDLDASLAFYCGALGLEEVMRKDFEEGRYTLVFLAAPRDRARAKEGPLSAGAPMVELTYNWDAEPYAGGRNFGHIAYRLPSACGQRRRHPPAAAGRVHGVCALTRRHLDRAFAEGRALAAGRALDLDGECGRVVSRLTLPPSALSKSVP